MREKESPASWRNGGRYGRASDAGANLSAAKASAPGMRHAVMGRDRNARVLLSGLAFLFARAQRPIRLAARWMVDRQLRRVGIVDGRIDQRNPLPEGANVFCAGDDQLRHGFYSR